MYKNKGYITLLQCIILYDMHATKWKVNYLSARTSICSGKIGCLKLVPLFLSREATLLNIKSNFATDIR